MFEAKGPPISLSMYTKFVVTVLCLVGKEHKKGQRLAMAREAATTTEIYF